ncbi:hypothetical protein [Pseudokordiimonas caeni]|uniref:hypothetical protein n=1 Tax=Pseudokordiimonas caeni TaxID=2997908 RepID=UPI0028114D1A|nr:hypothetical protein [Pseudokordiimonas caeni]
MGISPVLNGLVSKHIELQTRLRDIDDEAERIEGELEHLVKTITILDPFYPTDDLRPKQRRRKRVHCEWGNLKRQVAAFVYAAKGSFTSAEVRAALLERGSLQAHHADLTYLTLQISIHLKRLASHGIIMEEGRLKNGRHIMWRRAA